MTVEQFIENVRKTIDENFKRSVLNQPPFCGPFHPATVDDMKRLHMNCPHCGEKARKHK